VILGASGGKGFFVQEASEHLGLPARLLLNPNTLEESRQKIGMAAVGHAEVADMVSYVAHSDFVVTDSYQTMCLAILLEKPFAAVLYSGQQDGYRFTSLLAGLGLEGRLLYLDKLPEDWRGVVKPEPRLAHAAAKGAKGAAEEAGMEPIDYRAVGEALRERRRASRAWLLDALTRPKKAAGHFSPERYRARLPAHAEPQPLERFYKIQALQFEYEPSYFVEHWWLLNRGVKLAHDAYKGCQVMPPGTYAEFFTYFNALSVKKWKAYTKCRHFNLHLTIRGRFQVLFFGHYVQGAEIKKEEFERHLFDCPVAQEIRLPVQWEKSSVVGFSIEAASECELYGGHYSAECAEGALNPVELAVATTTFRKEEFIKGNIKLLKEKILESGSELAGHISISVIDNGRTLEPEELNCEGLTVYPNRNVGGAGGFTRGMLEALRAEPKPTHVLLMDDDVILSPESIFRTYALLRLLKDEYKGHFISGAMLFMEQMNVQHEDVGYVSKDKGAYGPEKPLLHMHTWDAVVRNEEDYDDYEHHYAGWWYCCMPTATVREDNLPLPLFIRGDDVEYSLRNKAEFISLNGICVWHPGFTGKYNAALELYLVHRNSLIVQAASGILQGIDFIARMRELFWRKVRCFDYSGADLILDAVDDYLAGPEFLMGADGEQVLREKSQKNERMVPCNRLKDTAQFKDVAVDFGAVYGGEKLGGLRGLVYGLTCNGHLLPKFFQKKGPAVIPYDWPEAEDRLYLRRAAIAARPSDKTVAVRWMSRRRFFALVRRYLALKSRYRRESGAVAARYREKAALLRSRGFWAEYLGSEG
jgi:GT2 family glycosyltransferase